MNAILYMLVALEDAPTGIIRQSADGTTLKNIFNVVLALAGAIAVAFVVWSGVKYILSQGEAAEIKKARDGVLYSVIGIVVVAFAFAIVNFVVGRF